MDASKEYLQQLESKDELAKYRNQFKFPKPKSGTCVYLNGNSLGLQPHNAEKYVQQELNDWEKYAVEGHFESETPWLNYHLPIRDLMAKIVGAKEEEVSVMNTLTVNLHLMMVSFYRPTEKRHKILMEYSPFPSDVYAIKSQLRFHGIDPEEGLIMLEADENEYVSADTIKSTFEREGESIALVLIGGVNYYTGQVYDMKTITKLGHEKGCTVGFDLAHGAGNIELALHDWDVDFAVWCTYKYLNSGPGSIAGAFVHEKHFGEDIPRFNGWWGHEEETRFLMRPYFLPSKGATAWQLSNPPIFAMAPIKASLEQFTEIGMEKLVKKSRKLVSYCRALLDTLSEKCTILTTDREGEFGAQLSIMIGENGKSVHEQLLEKGVFCDWREPNVIRVSFAPIYNNFTDVHSFYNILKQLLSD